MTDYEILNTTRELVEGYIADNDYARAQRYAESVKSISAEVCEALLASVEIAETVHNARQAELRAMLPNFKKGDRVKVIKPFNEDRTPCPIIGTPGKVVEVQEQYIRVKFRRGFTCTQGYKWYPEEEMVLKFLPDEVEVSPL